MLKLIHKKGMNGKYYTAIATTDSKSPLNFDATSVRLALAIASEQARKLATHYELNTPLSLLNIEQEWCIDITI